MPEEKKRKETIAHLSEVIGNLEESFPLTEKDQTKYMEAKVELDGLLKEKSQGMLFRSKARWYEEGEQNTKYFYNLERLRSNMKNVSVLIKENNQEITDLDGILQEQHNFYANLYKSDSTIAYTLKNTTNIRLSADMCEKISGQITEQELSTAVEKLAKDKSPGPDGLTAEVYWTFWRCIKKIFYEFVIESYSKGEITGSTMEGVLNLLPKANKDTRYLKNLRPITLLNVDYKIIEKVVAMRIQMVLPDIISYDQCGFMKGRRAASTIRKLIDLMDYCKGTGNTEAFHLCLDYKKAFDRPELKSIIGSLEFFNFPGMICEWIQILYKGFRVRIQNTGHFSDYVNIERSVHQGGCASAFLFIILAETLAIQIRGNPEIHGIVTGQHEQKINQFADDTSLTGVAEQKNLDKMLHELDSFNRNSGLEINYEKTVLYRISSQENLAKL